MWAWVGERVRRGSGVVDHKLAGTDPLLLVVAWLTTLVLGSITPEIVLRARHERGGSDRTTLFVQIGGLAVILALTWAWPTITPLRGFIWSLLATQVGYQLSFAVQSSPAWGSLTRGMSGGSSFIATEMLKTIPTAALAASLLGSGLGPRDVFVGLGDIHAISQPTLLTDLMPWTRLGPILAVVIALPLALYVGLTRGSDPAQIRKAAGLAPLILLGSGVNAFNEEFIFRAVLLARLSPVLGPAQSLWLTSVRFGVGHWFGNPSGPVGAAASTFAGWFWGKSILETRGLFWAWVIHAIQDVVIYSLVAMKASR
jgi:membrane protease YdiL (CAAX protease family)